MLWCLWCFDAFDALMLCCFVALLRCCFDALLLWCFCCFDALLLWCFVSRLIHTRRARGLCALHKKSESPARPTTFRYIYIYTQRTTHTHTTNSSTKNESRNNLKEWQSSYNDCGKRLCTQPQTIYHYIAYHYMMMMMVWWCGAAAAAAEAAAVAVASCGFSRVAWHCWLAWFGCA